MTVISVPNRLKAAIATLFLSVPLIAFEVIIATRSPLWRLPFQSIGYWSLTFSLICIPLCVWLATARKWAFPITVLLSGIWVSTSAWVALSMKYPPLVFFTILLLGYFVLELSWLKIELQRSFFNPQMAWYQGLPKPIPGLKCQLVSGEKSLDMNVSRVDQDGVFVYASEEAKNPALLSSFVDRRKLELRLNFRDRQVVCSGAPILSIEKGVGIQFLDSTSDLRKEVGDFIETLRGHGYV